MPMHSHAVRLLPLFTLVATLAAEEPVLLEPMIVEGPRREPHRHRRFRLGRRGRRRAARAPSAPAHRRNRRDHPRRHRLPAQRRGEGEPVLPARLQSRPRHRSPHHARRRAGQYAQPRARAGLYRSELPHPGVHPRGALQERAVLCRDRRLRVRRRFRYPPLRYPAAELRHHRGRHRWLCAPGLRPILPRRSGHAALRRRSSITTTGLGRIPTTTSASMAFCATARANDENGWSATAMAYHGDWTATDQIAQRAIDRGFPRFGSLDETTGGDSSRYSLQAEWHRSDDQSASKVLLYGMYYDLDLFSNFTYFLANPERGDQFEQKDRRIHWGGKASHTLCTSSSAARWSTPSACSSGRINIRNGLFSHRAAESLRHHPHRSHPRDERRPLLHEPHEVDRLVPHGSRRARGLLPLRCRERSRRCNSGNADDILASPKLSLIFGPWKQTELYLNGGFGFHSNDARGVITRHRSGRRRARRSRPIRSCARRAPRSASAPPRSQACRAPSRSGCWRSIPSCSSSAMPAPPRPAARAGAGAWSSPTTTQPTAWLTLDADFAFSQARFREQRPRGRSRPRLHRDGDRRRRHGARRARRPLGQRARARTSAHAISSKMAACARCDHARECARSATNSTRPGAPPCRCSMSSTPAIATSTTIYASRLRGEPEGPDDGGYNDRHLHPVEPRQVRFTVTANF